MSYRIPNVVSQINHAKRYDFGSLLTVVKYIIKIREIF